jgi:nucleotide-binding universal stress UspA family protein
MREYVPFPHQDQAYAESVLERQKKLLTDYGFNTEIVVDAGAPSSVIPRIADEQECSLIIVGSHGHKLTSEVLLGGTATEILHKSRIPVLIIPLRMDEKTGQPISVRGGCDFTHHVLYATDFSDHSQLAFEYVEKMVESGARRVTLLHVQDKARLDKHLEHKLDEFNKIDGERLEMLKKRLEEKGNANVDMEITYGMPVSIIVDRANDGETSVVVMGSHGRGFISELFLGSVSHNVARHSEVPVLLFSGIGNK